MVETNRYCLDGSTCRHVDLEQKTTQNITKRRKNFGTDIQDNEMFGYVQNRSSLKEHRGCRALREVRNAEIQIIITHERQDSRRYTKQKRGAKAAKNTV